MAINKTAINVNYTSRSYQQSMLKITAKTESSYLREVAAIVEILKDISSERIDAQEIAVLGKQYSVIFKPQKDGVLVYSASVKVKPLTLTPIDDEVF